MKNEPNNTVDTVVNNVRLMITEQDPASVIREELSKIYMDYSRLLVGHPDDSYFSTEEKISHLYRLSELIAVFDGSTEQTA